MFTLNNLEASIIFQSNLMEWTSLCLFTWWFVSLTFRFPNINIEWEKLIHGWGRVCFPVGFSGQCVSSVSHRLYRKLFTAHSIMCLASTACLPHYIMYFLFYKCLNIIEKWCWWIPRQQTKRSHLYCHEKQSRYWKYLFPVAGGDESYEYVLPAAATVYIFWLAQMENVTFTRGIICSPGPCSWGAVSHDVPMMRSEPAKHHLGPQAECYPSLPLNRGKTWGPPNVLCIIIIIYYLLNNTYAHYVLHVPVI